MLPQTSITASAGSPGIPPGGWCANKGRNFSSIGPASKKAPRISPNWRSHLWLLINCMRVILPNWLSVGDFNIPWEAFSDKSGSKWPWRHQRPFTLNDFQSCGSTSEPSWIGLRVSTKRLPMKRSGWSLLIWAALLPKWTFTAWGFVEMVSHSTLLAYPHRSWTEVQQDYCCDAVPLDIFFLR